MVEEPTSESGRTIVLPDASGRLVVGSSSKKCLNLAGSIKLQKQGLASVLIS